MKENVIANLTAKDDKYACAFADKIISESQETDEWYEYFDDFASLLDHPKSLVRTGCRTNQAGKISSRRVIIHSTYQGFGNNADMKNINDSGTENSYDI